MKTARKARTSGFSMVEVAFALGIATFAILTLMALLPVGVQANKISAEETKAISILTMLEADLRNSRPPENGTPLSKIFQVQLPYSLDVNGRYQFNPDILVLTPSDNLKPEISTGLDEGEHPVPFSSTPPPRFQVSVLYQSVPVADSLASLQARLVVNWPAIKDPTDADEDPTVADLTNQDKVEGYVEVITSFPAP